MHWSVPPGMATQEKPASKQLPASTPWTLVAEQSWPQKPPPSRVTQRSPGVGQSPSVVQGEQVSTDAGRHTVGPA
ncbi:MAG: hypothetical protein CSA66_07615 [Proteobacteria bacterium]|nr:MAG: hypothetical protein CSA66_07615 [Pseudomonadota bacterium]